MVRSGKTYCHRKLGQRWKDHLERETYFHGPPQAFDEKIIQCWETCLSNLTDLEEKSSKQETEWDDTSYDGDDICEEDDMSEDGWETDDYKQKAVKAALGNAVTTRPTPLLVPRSAAALVHSLLRKAGEGTDREVNVPFYWFSARTNIETLKRRPVNRWR